jgi:tripartite-type tricarboxylate transporter receptor subunit TctC
MRHARTVSRKSAFLLSIAFAAQIAASVPAAAQDWPNRAIRWIVSYPPGGATDITARLMGQWLNEKLGQPIVIENRSGGGNNIGTEMAVNSPPDGYTLFLVNPANTINTTLYKKLSFDFLRDMVPVATIIRLPNVMVVNNDVPAKSVAEFIAWAKQNPGKVNMASSGHGTLVHVSGELFKVMTGIDMLHVPYRGSAPALTDLIGGQVHVDFDNLPASMSHIKGGKIRALAVTTAQRLPMLPDVPTVAETLPGYEASGFYGIAVPKGTPADIVERLNRVVNAALADPKMQARFLEIGGIPHATTPAEYARILADETAKWAGVIKKANITLEQ